MQITQRFKLAGLLFIISLVSLPIQAKVFTVGETIMIGFPANNIKDDAYIIGVVKKLTKEGDYQISVRDFVEGHDYGLSCQPIDTSQAANSNSASSNGWEMWQDTKNLYSKQLEFIVPAKKAMKLSTGQLMFIERYNIYITYSRWKSNPLVMSIDRIISAQQSAKAEGVEQINPAFELAKLDRLSYYDSVTGRPYQPFESIKPLTTLLDKVLVMLEENPRLKKYWTAQARDGKGIEDDMEIYFLVDAIDKVVKDVRSTLDEGGLEDANKKDLKKLKQQLRDLVRPF